LLFWLGFELESGCEEEVEIRGCSIAVVERVYAELVARGCTKDQLVNPILIDQWLWTERRRIATEVEHIGYHKSRTIFY
jgi:Potential Queuosine, Q, salvage protein family